MGYTDDLRGVSADKEEGNDDASPMISPLELPELNRAPQSNERGRNYEYGAARGRAWAAGVARWVEDLRASLRGRRLFTLFAVVNLVNYLDRGVIPGGSQEFNAFIERSVHTNRPDVYLGVLQSSFILGFSVACLVFARMARYRSPFTLMGAGLGVWCAASCMAGLARPLGSYRFLLLARLLSGVGEASFVTVVPPLIAETAPPGERGLWLALFYTAQPVGAGLGYVYGSILATSRLGWQWAFYFETLMMAPLALACSLVPHDNATTVPNAADYGARRPTAAAVAAANSKEYRRDDLQHGSRCSDGVVDAAAGEGRRTPAACVDLDGATTLKATPTRGETPYRARRRRRDSSGGGSKNAPWFGAEEEGEEEQEEDEEERLIGMAAVSDGGSRDTWVSRSTPSVMSSGDQRADSDGEWGGDGTTQQQQQQQQQYASNRRDSAGSAEHDPRDSFFSLPLSRLEGGRSTTGLEEMAVVVDATDPASVDWPSRQHAVGSGSDDDGGRGGGGDWLVVSPSSRREPLSGQSSIPAAIGTLGSINSEGPPESRDAAMVRDGNGSGNGSSSVLVQDVLLIVDRPVFCLVVLGGAATCAVTAGMSTFGTGFVTSLELLTSETAAAATFGGVICAAGLVGTPAGGVFIDAADPEGRLGDGKKLGVVLMQAAGLMCGATVLVIAAAVQNSLVPFLLLFFIGGSLLFATTSHSNIAVMLASPKHLRPLALAVNSIALHALGDVPSPTIIGALKDALAPHCVAGVGRGDDGVVFGDAEESYDGVSTLGEISDACRSERGGIHVTLLVISSWLLWTCLFFGLACAVQKGALEQGVSPASWGDIRGLMSKGLMRPAWARRCCAGWWCCTPLGGIPGARKPWFSRRWTRSVSVDDETSSLEQALLAGPAMSPPPKGRLDD